MKQKTKTCTNCDNCTCNERRKKVNWGTVFTTVLICIALSALSFVLGGVYNEQQNVDIYNVPETNLQQIKHIYSIEERLGKEIIFYQDSIFKPFMDKFIFIRTKTAEQVSDLPYQQLAEQTLESYIAIVILNNRFIEAHEKFQDKLSLIILELALETDKASGGILIQK